MSFDSAATEWQPILNDIKNMVEEYGLSPMEASLVWATGMTSLMRQWKRSKRPRKKPEKENLRTDIKKDYTLYEKAVMRVEALKKEKNANPGDRPT